MSSKPTRSNTVLASGPRRSTRVRWNRLGLPSRAPDPTTAMMGRRRARAARCTGPTDRQARTGGRRRKGWPALEQHDAAEAAANRPDNGLRRHMPVPLVARHHGHAGALRSLSRRRACPLAGPRTPLHGRQARPRRSSSRCRHSPVPDRPTDTPRRRRAARPAGDGLRPRCPRRPAQRPPSAVVGAHHASPHRLSGKPVSPWLRHRGEPERNARRARRRS